MQMLLDALQLLYTPVEIGDFAPHLFSVIGKLVPGVFLSFDDLDLQSRQQVDYFSEPVPNERDYRATVAINLPRDHPGMAYVLGGGRERFWRLTDFTSLRQFQQTGLYWDQFKPLDIRYQVSVMLDVPGHIIGVSVNRKTDFTDAEITLLRQLTPHAAQAYVNAQLFADLQAAARSPVASAEALYRRGFTIREAEVLRWLMEGKRNIEIGIILDISPRTVGKHVERILAKLGVETRTAAAASARELLQSG